MVIDKHKNKYKACII